jgi:DNA-directed RNA polymerase
MCSCGEYYETKKGKWGSDNCPTCQKAARGMNKKPIYITWSVHYNKLWPDFFDFYREVGEPPGPSYMLSGSIPGTSPAPGNVRWIERSMTLGPLAYQTNTDYNAMLFDDGKLDALNKAAWHAANEDPNSAITILEHLEQDFKTVQEEVGNDSKIWQLRLEEMSEDYSKYTKQHAEGQAAEKGRTSQTRLGRGFRNQLVPVLAIRLEEQHKTALSRQAGRHHHVIKPVMDEVDYLTAAHIIVTVVLDNLGRGARAIRTLSGVFSEIGEKLDHQAYLNKLKRVDPKYYERVDRYVLRSSVMGYSQKIRRSQQGLSEDFQHDFLDAKAKAHLGDWGFSCLQSICLWFDTLKYYSPGKKKKATYFLTLSVEGLKYRDLIQAAADDQSYESWPMVCPPLPWEFEEGQVNLRGGYLKSHVGKLTKLIRNNRGTVPSENALKALHNMQAQPFTLNHFIYDLMKQLLKTSVEIGRFRTFEKESWDAKNDPRPFLDPQIWEDGKYDHNRNIRPEWKKAQAILEKWHSNREVAKKERVSPFRVLMVAARFSDVERFYLPAYFDNRLRMYYMPDTLNPQGCDYQKALLLYADGNPVTADNREAVRRDLLVTIANTWANKTDTGVKSDKLSMDGRVAFSEDFLKELEVVARDPLHTSARAIWESADEPFQFLATVREYFEIFVWKTSTVARVANGRDATNSGSQILGALIRDQKTCHYTNVIPTEAPQDLYGVVAKEAQGYLNNFHWVSEQEKNCQKRAKKKMERLQAEGAENYVIDGSKLVYNHNTSGFVDRSVCKRPSMCTAYGASWQSKNEYVTDELEDIAKDLEDVEFSLTDKVVVTNAVIAGQAAAFPLLEELNQWFKHLAKACLNADLEYVTWVTPNGSKIVQEYREILTEQVTTYAMGGGAYWRPVEQRGHGGERRQGRSQISFQTGFGGVKESKTQTALGANWTHSHDACIMHDTLCDWDEPFYAVHDCFYGPAGTMEALCEKARQAFHDVVTFDCFDTLVKTNQVEIDMPHKGNADIESCTESAYMFS